MIPSFIDKTKLVHQPGVYIYHNDQGQVLYVGKAIDLNKRIASYFNGQSDNLKTQTLVSKIASVETVVVESELEALILEANLIKKYLPPFNVRLTDDKDYLYIKVTKAEFPEVVTARRKDLTDGLDYFGPFPSSNVVRSTLKMLRRIFPWCSGGRQHRACFYYHLHLCPGACVGLISRQDYLQIINRFRRFMDGQKQGLVEELTKEMASYAAKLDFERAQQIKRILVGVDYITQPNHVSFYLDNPNFAEDQRAKSLADLQTDLRLPSLPSRIEAYDISNFQGHSATGSMVVLTDGEVDKSQYRRFKIKIAGKPNDFAMHAEMMSRRLKHADWPLPDLFLIDGGRGQVRASADELAKKGLSRPIYGLAKRMEWLYPVEGEVVKLPKRSLSLRLLQKIRDEAHRFAVNYHRKLRFKTYDFSTR